MRIALSGAVSAASGPFIATYETLVLIAQGSGGVTLTGNNTTTASFFKTSGTSNWDTQVYSNQGYSAPVTLEFNKLAAADGTDNTVSYAMISLNDNPTADANFSSLDMAAYAYETDNYRVYHSGSEIIPTSLNWSNSSKFYIVYDTDGNIKHYNGNVLLFTIAYGTDKTLYLDSSLNRVNSTFGGFSNVRITKNTWDGTKYLPPTGASPITGVTLLSSTQLRWDAISGASSYTVTASPSLGAISVSGTTATFATAMSANTTYSFTITPNTGSAITCNGYMLGYTGSAQTLSVGSGTRRFTLLGAAGGAGTVSTEGPAGGRSFGTYSGSGTIYVYVGGRGGNYCVNSYSSITCANTATEGIVGWNGGALGGTNGGAYGGIMGCGGGATDIRLNGTALSDRILIAGGGAGWSGNSTPLGNGGGEQGNLGARAYGYSGSGGTQSAGGTGGSRPGYSGVNGSNGSFGAGGAGGNCGEFWCQGGGGGGGGYYGGGGGEAGDSSFNNGGSQGGGGSGFANTSILTNTVLQGAMGSSSNGMFLMVWNVS